MVQKRENQINGFYNLNEKHVGKTDLMYYIQHNNLTKFYPGSDRVFKSADFINIPLCLVLV